MCKYVEMGRLWKAGRIVFVLAALSPAMIKMRILAYITMSQILAYITMSHNLAYITMSHNLAYITMSQSLTYITMSQSLAYITMSQILLKQQCLKSLLI